MGASAKGNAANQTKIRMREAAPSYLQLRDGELRRRIEHGYEMLSHCGLCPRDCAVNRLAGGEGYCRAGADPVVASWASHPWEEPPISGTNGSGTIFFTHCTARCVFCQNYPISQLGVGRQVSVQRLAKMMLELQARGCHNVNLVTPTHFVPQILAALSIAIDEGLHLPLVYNSSGYETIETLQLLNDVVDIYLPDAKYADDGVARRLSGFRRYVEVNRAALREMYRQVGAELLVNENELAVRGMIIRHMVLPEKLAGTWRVLFWIARELSPSIHISLLAQYFPAHKAVGDPILGRRITTEEYLEALAAFDALGLERGWRQDHCQEE